MNRLPLGWLQKRIRQLTDFFKGYCDRGYRIAAKMVSVLSSADVICCLTCIEVPHSDMGWHVARKYGTSPFHLYIPSVHVLHSTRSAGLVCGMYIYATCDMPARLLQLPDSPNMLKLAVVITNRIKVIVGARESIQ